VIEFTRLCLRLGLTPAEVDGWLAARYLAAGRAPVPLRLQPRAVHRAVVDLLAGLYVARFGKASSS
jgi:hypothetical protein